MYNIQTIVGDIDNLLNNYAKTCGDYDSSVDTIEDKYNSPDAYEMLRAKFELLKFGYITRIPFSSYYQGGYIYNNKTGEDLHNKILVELQDFLK